MADFGYNIQSKQLAAKALGWARSGVKGKPAERATTEEWESTLPWQLASKNQVCQVFLYLETQMVHSHVAEMPCLE